MSAASSPTVRSPMTNGCPSSAPTLGRSSKTMPCGVCVASALLPLMWNDSRLRKPMWPSVNTFGSNWPTLAKSDCALMASALPSVSAKPDEKYGSRSCRNALSCRISRIFFGLTLPGPPAASSTSAAIAAACGAAALVPKKFGNVSGSVDESLQEERRVRAVHRRHVGLQPDFRMPEALVVLVEVDRRRSGRGERSRARTARRTRRPRRRWRLPPSCDRTSPDRDS